MRLLSERVEFGTDNCTRTTLTFASDTKTGLRRLRKLLETPGVTIRTCARDKTLRLTLPGLHPLPPIISQI